jgi:DNA repair protein REV1
LDELPAFIAPLEISDLHGFGYNTKQKALDKLGTSKLGDLTSKSKSVLCDALGRTTGETLYNAIRGIDEKQLESSKERKSVSCEISVSFPFGIYFLAPHATFYSMEFDLRIMTRRRNSYTKWRRK